MSVDPAALALAEVALELEARHAKRIRALRRALLALRPEDVPPGLVEVIRWARQVAGIEADDAAAAEGDRAPAR